MAVPIEEPLSMEMCDNNIPPAIYIFNWEILFILIYIFKLNTK